MRVQHVVLDDENYWHVLWRNPLNVLTSPLIKSDSSHNNRPSFSVDRFVDGFREKKSKVIQNNHSFKRLAHRA